jgi:hypothetical protein
VLRKLWSESIGFRRALAALSLIVVAGTLYLASQIPQTASLPNSDIDTLAAVHQNEELHIYKPQIEAGEAALSLEGAANVGAEVWVQHATLTGVSAIWAALAPPGPSIIVYAGGGAKPLNKTCRTSLTISRTKDKAVPQILKLWQQGTNSDDQRFRELIVSSPESALHVEVSTDSPLPGQSLCPRVVTVGSTAIPVPAGPVELLVPANEPIKLLFSAIDPGSTLWPTKKDTFDGLSLGDGDLRAEAFDVVSTTTEKTPLLHVVAHKGTKGITLHDLSLRAEEASLSIGEDREQADAWANGTRFPVFDLIGWIQKNPLLSTLLAAVAIPALLKWIQQVCFPRKPGSNASV